jgi:hypothetical protein
MSLQLKKAGDKDIDDIRTLMEEVSMYVFCSDQLQCQHMRTGPHTTGGNMTMSVILIQASCMMATTPGRHAHC